MNKSVNEPNSSIKTVFQLATNSDGDDAIETEIDALVLKNYISICDRLLNGEKVGPLHGAEFAALRILRHHAEQALHRHYGDGVYFKKVRDELVEKIKEYSPYILFLMSSLIIFLLIVIMLRVGK